MFYRYMEDRLLGKEKDMFAPLTAMKLKQFGDKPKKTKASASTKDSLVIEILHFDDDD